MAKSNRVTLKTLAQRLDVSTMTVSRALNDHPDISKETKARVLNLAKELNFRLDGIAKSLVQKRTNTIGVIFPEISHSFFPDALKGIEHVAYNNGYQIIICHSDEKAEREQEAILTLESKRVDGILVSIAQDTVDPTPYYHLQNNGTPFVFFDRYLKGFNANRVVVNDEEGACRMVEYMIKCGYKKIAHISGPLDVSISLDRLEGYKNALLMNKLPILEDYIVMGGFHEDLGYQAMKELLNLPDRPQAVFAVNDPAAIGAFRAIKEMGLTVPKDIALAGFADIQTAECFEVPLTTVRQPAFEVGEKAAQLLIKKIEDKEDGDINTIEVETELKIRKSC
ncbi:MAG: LacI family DNA-binding transcriptional regulator [Gemmatimonadota bacterium]|nr:MAG: LacI family DNA-binding transcriptional regulator [Gemmatimonadota bacterium]